MTACGFCENGIIKRSRPSNLGDGTTREIEQECPYCHGTGKAPQSEGVQHG